MFFYSERRRARQDGGSLFLDVAQRSAWIDYDRGKKRDGSCTTKFLYEGLVVLASIPRTWRRKQMPGCPSCGRGVVLATLSSLRCEGLA